MTRWIASLLLALLCLASAPAQAREWVRAELPGMVIYSDGDAQELTAWARDILVLDMILRARLFYEKNNGSPLTIYLLARDEDVAELAGLKNQVGFYRASSEGSFAVASRTAPLPNRLSGRTVMFHEYTHHLVNRHLNGAYPAWFHEGLAEYFSTAVIDADGRVHLGLPPPARLKALRRKPPSIETLLNTTVEDLPTRDRPRFYAWSWKLVHMLYSRRGEYRSVWFGRQAHVDEEGGSGKFVKEVFGDIKTLEIELRAYDASKQNLTAGPIFKSEIHVRNLLRGAISSLSTFESQLIDLRLARQARGLSYPEITALRALGAQHPDNSAVQLELAFAERAIALKAKKPDFARAEAAAGVAVAIAPNDARAQAIKAELDARRLAIQPNASDADWDRIREPLFASFVRGSRDPFAHMSYFRTYIWQRKMPTKTAFFEMRRAYNLQPESYEVRTSQIISLALQRQFNAARQLANLIASDPHAPGLGANALALIARMEKAPKGADLPALPLHEPTKP